MTDLRQFCSRHAAHFWPGAGGDPQSPWQRGSNENTNGPLRQYFPNGTDLSVHSQAHLTKVARQLKDRTPGAVEIGNPHEEVNGVGAADALPPTANSRPHQ